MLDYTLSDGRRDCLISITQIYEKLMANKSPTKENIQQAHLLGWAMEMVSC